MFVTPYYLSLSHPLSRYLTLLIHISSLFLLSHLLPKGNKALKRGKMTHASKMDYSRVKITLNRLKRYRISSFSSSLQWTQTCCMCGRLGKSDSWSKNFFARTKHKKIETFKYLSYSLSLSLSFPHTFPLSLFHFLPLLLSPSLIPSLSHSFSLFTSFTFLFDYDSLEERLQRALLRTQTNH